MKLILAFLFTTILTLCAKSQIDTIKVSYFKDVHERKEVKKKKADYCLINYKSGDTVTTSFFNMHTGHVLEQKQFLNNKQVGTWYVYDYMKKSSTKIVYGFRKLNNVIEYNYSNDSILSNTTNFIPALLKDDNSKKLPNYIVSNFSYPFMAKENGDQGEVNVQMVIGNEGEILEIRIESEAGEYIDSALVKVINKLILTPATKNGIRTEMIGYMKFKFILK